MSSPEFPSKPRPQQENAERIVIRTQAEYGAMAAELARSREVFPFPGILPSAYEILRLGDEMDKENNSDHILAPSSDQIIEGLRSKGMRVFVGRDPRSAFILPPDADNTSTSAYLDASMRPRYLDSDKIVDPKLRALVIADQNWVSLSK